MSVVKNPRKIYIGNIPRDVSETEVEKLFKEIGKIIGFEFKGDFAFVEFDDSDGAEEAIKSLDGTRLRGRKLVVEPFRYRGGDPRYRRPPPKGKRGQYRVIVSGISSDTTADDIRRWVEGEKLKSIALTDVYNRHGMSEGVIEFIDQDEFETAIKKLDRTKFSGHTVRVYDERDYNRRKLKTYGVASRRDRDRDRDRDRNRDRSNDGHSPRDRDRFFERDHDRRYRGDNGYSRHERSRTRSRSRDREIDRYRAQSRDRSQPRERDRDRDRDRDREREKERDRDRDHNRERERERERDRDRDRDRDRESKRSGSKGDKHKDRDRDRSRDREIKDKDKEQDRARTKSREKEKKENGRDKERSRSKRRSQS